MIFVEDLLQCRHFPSCFTVSFKSHIKPVACVHFYFSFTAGTQKPHEDISGKHKPLYNTYRTTLDHMKAQIF